MRLTTILTPLCAVTLLFGGSVNAQQSAPPLTPGDQAVLEMKRAFTAKNRARLAQLLPTVQGHPLEGWGSYWELTNRLRDAQPQEVDAFLSRWNGTYYEDRLRNDWLLQLGQRRQWGQFEHYANGFRMQDDPQVRCYQLLIDDIEGNSNAATPQQVLSLWWGQRNADDGCTYAVSELFADGRIQPEEIWQRARIGAHFNRPAVVRSAVLLVSPQSLPHVENALGKASAFLANPATATDPARRALVPLALARLAGSDVSAAATQMDTRWARDMSPQDRDFVWGAIGRWAGIRLSPDAPAYFARVQDDRNMLEEQQHWKVRAALRAGQWPQVARTIDAMSANDQQSPTWSYWRARALQATGQSGDALRARQILQQIAGPNGFYEQLAANDLGRTLAPAPEPPAPTQAEMAAARSNAGLLRGLYAIDIGLRSEGVREWNYTTSLHDRGGMPDRELLAAAELACQQHVWDRCINTSERTREMQSFRQRFPMPFREVVVARTSEIDLDPAYVYGLIRQESRFIMDARSSVGASGLMQIMPATAKWTANKIGMKDFRPGDINHKQTNIAIGTAYLKLALDEFSGSMPLAAAAYNAGPGRPRNWRNGPVLETAIWAENVPFNETRDYVQKVLANATIYGAILSGEPQTLQQRLGQRIGPRQAGEPLAVADLP